MVNNHMYNLMAQMVQEHKSLWRIKNKYMVDAEECQMCKAFWEKLADAKEANVAELQEILKDHMS